MLVKSIFQHSIKNNMERRFFLKNSGIVTAGSIFLPSLLKAASYLNDNGIKATVNAAAAGKKYAKFWSKCMGAGRANEGLRASWLEQMALAKKHCGFEFVRFHGLFHDDMFVYSESSNGKITYNWQYIDELFDRLLEIGVKPFVEFGFMPKDLSSDDSYLQFWWKAHIGPPKDYNKWATLVAEFTKHCIQRYGLTEVRSWYFEIWNEPNLRGFWLGTKSQYFELYKVSVKAIKAIDSKLRVGGPSTSNFVPDDRFDGEVEDKSKAKTHSVPDLNTLPWRGVWIEDFLKYCTKENLPLDFISCHPYPTDWALDPMTGKGGDGVRKVGATKDDLEWLKRVIAKSNYPNVEVHLTEWSSSPSSRDAAHDSLPVAAYIIKANIDSIGLTDSLSYWTFTDVFEEKGGGNTIWHGGFGMINFQGIVKPSFHAYRMLNALGDEILHNEDGLIVTRHSATNKIVALLYHFPVERKQVPKGGVEDLLKVGTPRTFSLELSKLKQKEAFTIETLDVNNGYAYKVWKEMGKPEPPTREQLKQLKVAAWATQKEKLKVGVNGSAKFERTLPPWTCVLIS
jgi:xylan 1,4-beta-xylosidase